MASTFTPNIQLEEPARGDQVGVWDTAVNGNSTLLDLTIGGITTIGLNNANVVLSAAQFKSKQITFNSTLTGSVSITFPTSFTKSYEIQNLCTGSSAFVITLTTTAAGGQVICCPPGVTTDVFNDGTNIKFKNLWGPVGTFFDYAGSSNPAWNTGCTVPPLLNCDGSAIPAAYVQLPIILGSSLLPDMRGTARATLNQGTGRINSSNCGIDGNTNYSRGGVDQVTLAASQIPANIPNTLNLNGGGVTYFLPTADWPATNTTGGSNANVPTTNRSAVNLGGTVTINASLGGNLHTNMPPTTIAGLCLIRAG
jgi:microcystin-dependent protein